MAHLLISTLGSFTIALDGQVLHGFESDKVRALLAYLAVESDLAHSRGKLAALLWPEASEAHAHANFNQALYNLRQVLGERQTSEFFLIVSRQTVQFNLQCDCRVDVHLFSRLLAACERHPHVRLEACGECATQLEKAVELYRGGFLEGFTLPDSIPFDEWALIHRERLSQQFLTILSWLVAYNEGEGKIAQALGYARRAVEIEPLWEEGQRSLMRLLALDGRREAALWQYQTLRALLKEELSVEPDLETQALYQRLRIETQEAPWERFNLPAPLTPFIGRQAELAELSALLRDPGCRLVTVLGAGGSGKTRLALQAAQGLRYHFPDGVYLVPLSALKSVEGLVPALAEALEFIFSEGTDPKTQLENYLRAKGLLLILDSFETVLEGAGWLSGLLRAAPRVKALVTSRGRLNLEGERLFPLGGMPYPGEDASLQKGFDPAAFSAVALFRAGVERQVGAPVWDDQDWKQVARICRLVEGLPLGLLLASAWVGSYSLAEIAGEIKRSLDFLAVDWQDVPPRQRSLRATLDYSWRLLSEAQRELFARLSVFQGSFTRQEAWGVARAYPLALQVLVDKSVLELRPPGQFAMHDMLRQFASQRLSEDPQGFREVCSRHSRFYLSRLADCEKDLTGNRQRQALEIIDRDVENLRAAWRWAITARDWDSISAGLEGMAWYADLRFRFEEGERACRTAREAIPPLSYPYLVTELTTWQAHFLRRLGQTENARELLQTELTRLEDLQTQSSEDRARKAHILYELGELSMSTDRETAKNYYQSSLSLYDALGDERGLAITLTSLGEALHHTGPLDQAQLHLERGVALCRRLGDPRLMARCIYWSGWNYIRQGSFSQGEALVRESIEINRSIGDRYAEAFYCAELGRVLGWSGHLREGMELFSQSIEIYHELNLTQEATFILLIKGLVEQVLLELASARQDLQTSISASYQQKYLRGIGVGMYGLGCVSLSEGDPQKAEELFLQAITILRDVQADEEGWCMALLVFTTRAMNQPQRAWQYARQALEIGLKAHAFLTAAVTIRGIAVLLADDGQAERAIELHELTMRHPVIERGPFYQALSVPVIDQISANLPHEVVEAARQRGQKRDMFLTAEELLREIPNRESTTIESVGG